MAFELVGDCYVRSITDGEAVFDHVPARESLEAGSCEVLYGGRPADPDLPLRDFSRCLHHVSPGREESLAP